MIGGRAMQVLPREAHVTGQNAYNELLFTKKRVFIMSLPYIGQVKQSAKYTKNLHV